MVGVQPRSEPSWVFAVSDRVTDVWGCWDIHALFHPPAKPGPNPILVGPILPVTHNLLVNGQVKILVVIGSELYP